MPFTDCSHVEELANSLERRGVETVEEKGCRRGRLSVVQMVVVVVVVGAGWGVRGDWGSVLN